MTGATPHPRRRLGGALAFSIAVHLLLLAALVWVKYSNPREEPRVAQSEPLDERIVWIAMPGPSGGGGGGRTVTPPPPEPAPPKATRTEEPPAPVPVPMIELEPLTLEPVELQPPAPALIADAVSPGAAVTPATAGGGREPGPGSGPGDGSGTGPGADRGFGGDTYLPGNGVTVPVPIERATPSYTDAAVRNRAQGVVTVACVVETNGQCGDLRIVRTFRPPYGLDQQALAAARRWRFEPGTREGKPVRVRVNLEIEFNIR